MRKEIRQGQQVQIPHPSTGEVVPVTIVGLHGTQLVTICFEGGSEALLDMTYLREKVKLAARRVVK
jgi:hypothetical protein